MNIGAIIMFTKEQLNEFLQESNYIEQEYSSQAMEDSIKAWDFAYKNKDLIDINYILEIHRLLAINLRPDIAGKIRNCDVFIGGKRKIFIDETIIKSDLLMKVCFEMLARGIEDREEWTKQIHVVFEEIHPFFDFNGRSGRLLWQIHRLNLGLPLHIIHEGEEQSAYYKWFQ